MGYKLDNHNKKYLIISKRSDGHLDTHPANIILSIGFTKRNRAY
jgi:hypothetical protein